MIKTIEPYELNQFAQDVDAEIKRAILTNMGRFGLAITELIRRQNEAIGSAYGDPNDESTWFDPNDLERDEAGGQDPEGDVDEEGRKDGTIFPLAGIDGTADQDVPPVVGGDDERTRPSDQAGDE